MTGTVNISRRILKHPAFKDEPFTEREAWIWMIFEASFRDRDRRIADRFVVELERGQLAASSRFMADAWQWSEARVRRFLERLKKRRMIDRVTDAGINVLTICNYEEYQGRGGVGDALNDAPPTHNRRTSDAPATQTRIPLESTGDPKKEEASSSHARAHEETLIDRVISAVGLNPSNIVPRHWMPPTSAMHIEKAWRSLGLTDDEMVEVATASRKRHADPPNGPKALDGAMADFAAAKATSPAAPRPNGNGYGHSTGPPLHRRIPLTDVVAAEIERIEARKHQR